MTPKIELAGIWELGWSAPITEADQWWTVMREFHIETLNMAPISGIRKRWLQEYKDIDEIISETKLTPVIVDENAEIELEDFVHPENALYVFGKGAYSPFSRYAIDNLSVKIFPGEGMLWPHQAAAIVLYDRAKKQ